VAAPEYNAAMRNFLRFSVLGCFLAASLPGGAQTLWDGWDYKYDREILPWSELVADLPPYPSDTTLIPLEIDVVTPHRYFVDAKSVSTGKDGVVRYTLVVKTAGGATNISFEGIRCDSAEQKYYAIGRPADRSWARARDPQWRAFSVRQGGVHHASLYQWYFCRVKTAEPPDRILRALRAGIPRPQLLE
jgi:hypothetical protein